MYLFCFCTVYLYCGMSPVNSNYDYCIIRIYYIYLKTSKRNCSQHIIVVFKHFVLASMAIYHSELFSF